jgi:hypothetical protein
MIPYDIDPSLHTGEPDTPSLDDGFSPPRHEEPAEPAQPLQRGEAEALLGEISPF